MSCRVGGALAQGGRLHSAGPAALVHLDACYGAQRGAQIQHPSLWCATSYEVALAALIRTGSHARSRLRHAGSRLRHARSRLRHAGSSLLLVSSASMQRSTTPCGVAVPEGHTRRIDTGQVTRVTVEGCADEACRCGR